MNENHFHDLIFCLFSLKKITVCENVCEKSFNKTTTTIKCVLCLSLTLSYESTNNKNVYIKKTLFRINSENDTEQWTERNDWEKFFLFHYCLRTTFALTHNIFIRSFSRCFLFHSNVIYCECCVLYTFEYIYIFIGRPPRYKHETRYISLSHTY